MITVIINLIIIMLLPFMFSGLINKTKAFWAGRQGPALFQSIYDFIKLLKKDQVISSTSSYVFIMAPVISYSAVVFAALLVPIFGGHSIISFDLDFVLFSYMLAMGKFFQVIAAMDTGSSFEGMGASRDVTFNTIVEPGFFILLGSLCALNSTYSFEKILQLSYSSSVIYPIIILAAVVLFIIMLVEGGRVPFSDPNTHLELTMIHEVMVLDNSGPDLALIIHGSAIKITLLAILIADILLPSGHGDFSSIGLLLLIVFFIALLIGTIESFFARVRMTHVPQYIFLNISLGLIVLLLSLLFIYGGA